MFASDTFVNVAHPLNKKKCHFSFSFLCSIKFTKEQSFCWQMFNLNCLISSILRSFKYHDCFWYLLCLWIMFWKWLCHCIHRWALAFFFSRQVKSKRGYSLTWSWKTRFDCLNKKWISKSNSLLVSWKSHVYGGSFTTNTKLERVQLYLFHTFLFLIAFSFKFHRQYLIFQESV